MRLTRDRWSTAVVVLCAASCTPEPSPPLGDHIQAPPLHAFPGVAIGMSAREFRSLHPDLLFVPYTGYADSTSYAKTTFLFTDPCGVDSRPEEDCPVRGTLAYIDVVIGPEPVDGPTLFMELWGAVFRDASGPVYCYRTSVQEAGGRGSLEGREIVAHWDSESGFWATLKKRSFPREVPDSARTSYRIGWGEHSHDVAVPNRTPCGDRTNPD